MPKKEKYFSEVLTEYFSRRFRIDKIYYQGKTQYQQVHCFYNQFLGKALFLDFKIQSAQVDEHIYHESLVQPILISHPCPKRVLVIGGGEGATIREVLRHSTVEKVIMVDIDEELVRLCQKYLPEWSDGAFNDPRTELIFDDARQYIKKTRERFDVIVSDLTEPLDKGPSVYLFTREFFEMVFQALKKDGLFVCQAGGTDPFYNQFFCSIVKTLEKVFPLVRPYWTFVFSFGLPWGFVLTSKKSDPLQLTEEEISRRMSDRTIKRLQFYHQGLHRSFFVLPLYLLEDLKEKGKILSDKRPFIWKL